MPSRMEKYTDDNKRRLTRSEKHKDLYNNIGNNTRYTNISEVTNSNAFEINDVSKDLLTRENYQKAREYQEFVPITKEKKELADFNYLYQDRENKVYDINKVLEEARKKRTPDTIEESKRKLKDDSYNIIKNLSDEELANYKKNRIERKVVKDEEELRELIDTITSKTLAGEIDKDMSVNLLSDLMATNVLDKVNGNKEEEQEEVKEENQEVDIELALSKEVLDKDQLDKIQQMKEDTTEEESLKNADNSFYTKSMDLSDKDFETTDDFVEEKTSPLFKVIATIIILIGIGVAAYFIWLNLK